MDAILFDLDGVLYEGNRSIDGAAETISWCNTNSRPHLFLTNTSSKPRSALVTKFADFNILSAESNNKVDAVIIVDMRVQWDFSTLNNAFRLLISNPESKLVALGMTRYWRADDGLRLDAGSIKLVPDTGSSPAQDLLIRYPA